MRTTTAVLITATLCSSVSGCTVRARRPAGPYQLAEEFADAFSDQVVACTRKHPPEGSGYVTVAAECATAENAPTIHDMGSLATSDAAVACIRERATEKLRCPPKAPAPFVRIRAPVPLDTSKVTYAFMHELPSATPEPTSPQP